jgi:hypothetical protein
MDDQRFQHARDVFYTWNAFASRRQLTNTGFRVFREGKGSYAVQFDFSDPDVVRVVASRGVGPSRDPEALKALVAQANAEDPSLPFELPDPDDLRDPFVYLRGVVPRIEGGVTIAELDACRQGLVERMNAYEEAFRAIGTLPFIVHVGEDGVGRMSVDAGRVRQQEEEKARLAAADPSPEKPKDTKGE